MSTKGYHNKSLEKGLNLLEILCQHSELTVSEAAKLMGVARPSAHRYLAALREAGYVEMTERSHYTLTFKLMRLGAAMSERFEIRNLARPAMLGLSQKFNETVNLGHWTGRGAVLLETMNSREILRSNSMVGEFLPAYCTSNGKAMLAFLPESELNWYVENVEFESIVPNTITDRDEFLKHIQQIRERGYALEDEEFCLGLTCVGVPVMDHRGYPEYALSIAGPKQRFNEQRIDTIQQEMKKYALELSRQLSAGQITSLLFDLVPS